MQLFLVGGRDEALRVSIGILILFLFLEELSFIDAIELPFSHFGRLLERTDISRSRFGVVRIT